MSLLNKASLIQIPSGYKDGTLYSAKPTNGDGDFTFSRGSNLGATRVNSEGLIEKGRENLLLQSNSFDTTWSNSNSTETSGQSGYDGSSNAWLLESTINGSSYIQQTNTTSGVQTFSIYAKAGTTDWFRVIGAGSPDYLAFFDLSNGVVGNTLGSGNIDTSIESVGNGWYRCSITGNNTISRIILNIGVDDNNISTVIGDNIYIQDAQLELGLVATDYIETTTTTEQAGILEDMPRLDYSGGASCPSLLLEPQRSNVLAHSEYLSSYSEFNISISDNQGNSPEGVTNASLATENTSNNAHEISMPIASPTLTLGDNNTISIFAKQNSGTRNLVLYVGNAARYANGRYAIFNLDNGTVVYEDGTATGKIEDYGNGWYRCIVTGTASGSGTTTAYVGFANGTSLSYLGDGSSSMLWYGLQMEYVASYPTSYIPTYGASSTRSKDVCSKTGVSSLIGQTEGVVFVDFEVDRTPTSTDRVLILNDGTGNERIGISLGNSGLLYAFVVDGNITQAEIIRSSTTAGRYKAAFAYKENDFVFYVNGTQIGSDTNGTISNCSQIDLGNQLGASMLGGNLNQAILFKTRLSNDELASLTTI